MLKRITLMSVLGLSILFITSCGTLKKGCCSKKHGSQFSAKANLQSTKGYKTTGWILIEKIKDQQNMAKVTAKVVGLTPNQKHGFHIHEFGDCTNQALNAGGHFDYQKSKRGHGKKSKYSKKNHHKHKKHSCSSHKGKSSCSYKNVNSKKSQHGPATGDVRHYGDLGNLMSDKKGNANYEAVVNIGYLKKLQGRSVVIHLKEDDLKTQPTGNSGNRISCGVLGISLDKTIEKKPAKDKKASMNMKKADMNMKKADMKKENMSMKKAEMKKTDKNMKKADMNMKKADMKKADMNMKKADMKKAEMNMKKADMKKAEMNMKKANMKTKKANMKTKKLAVERAVIKKAEMKKPAVKKAVAIKASEVKKEPKTKKSNKANHHN